mgnify:CR=1 FL=1
MSNEPQTLPNSDLKFVDITTRNITSDGTITISSLVALSQIETSDIMIKLANGNAADILDTGWYSEYNDGAVKYRGCVYDASASKFVFFNSTTDPSATIGSGYTLLDVTVKDLVSTNVTGTLLTAAQPNITSVGTLTSLTLAGALSMGTNAISGVTTLTATTLAGTLSTAAQPNITSVGTLTSLTLAGTLSMGTNAISGVTTLTATSVSATNLTGTLQTAAQPNITSVGTLTSLTLAGTLSMGTNAISGVTTLTATTVTATNVAGTLSTAAQPNITSVGTLSSLALAGTLNMGTNAISGVTTLTATTLAGTLSTAAQPNITSVGTLTSLALAGAISGVTTLTATNVAGTLTTAAQPNITSVGTLTSLSLAGAISGVTTLTATTLAGTLSTAAQPNITSVGTLTSLALAGAISGVTTLTATTLAGTLSTAAQPNITSVGTLTSLTLGGTLNMATNAITNVGTLTATTISGTLSTVAQTNITSVGTLTSLTTSGVITAANGSVSAPSYSFTNSTGSGMYYTGTANTIALATNGTARLTLDTLQVKIDSSVNLLKNTSFTFRTMQNNSSSTSATISTTQDFQYQFTGAPTEVYIHDSNTTSNISTNTAVGLLAAPIMVYTSTQSNGCYLDYDCKSISFAKGVYKLIHDHLYNDNTAIIDVAIKHSGSGSYTTYRTIDTYSGRATTSNLFNYFETYFAVTTAGTINVRFTANGKNASSTAYFVCVGNFRLYLLSSIA